MGSLSMEVRTEVLCGYICDLEAENATLRELIKDLYADMWASGEWLEPYEQRMRELGIEVE